MIEELFQMRLGSCVTVSLEAPTRRLMFGLLYGFYEYLTRKDEHKVVVLGLDSAGKSVSVVGCHAYH